VFFGVGARPGWQLAKQATVFVSSASQFTYAPTVRDLRQAVF